MRAYERLLKYVKVWTTSDPESGTHPSTMRQFDLAHQLVQELKDLGLTDAHVDEHCYVYATLPAPPGQESAAPLGLIAHMDTADDASGENVRPQIHENYDGEAVTLPATGTVLDPKVFPFLREMKGQTLITTDGSTLLGADDKAGVAEIMAMLEAFRSNPELRHGEIRVCFHCDEEIGAAAPPIDPDRLTQYCYTVDGSHPGEVESECFSAERADLVFKGNGVHPGYGFQKLINASTAMAAFMRRLPPDELPETTRDRQGFFYVQECSGGCETAKLAILLRDFDREVVEERAARVRAWAAEVEAEIPGLVVEVAVKDQYPNMIEYFAGHEKVLEMASRATQAVGLTVIDKPIRGGTVGSQLSAVGHPCPNLGAGGMLFHSLREWVTVQGMTRETLLLIVLAELWVQDAETQPC